MKTLVIGSTGMVGSNVVQALLNRGEIIRCMTHFPSKIQNVPRGIEISVANLDDRGSLKKAFEGVDNAFLVVSVSRNETVQGLNAVEAAKDAGVGRFVYLSVAMPPGSEIIPHFSSKIPIENAIRRSGLKHTILQPNNFYQNDISVISIITTYGIYPAPIGRIGVNRIDVRDIADAAANALLKPGYEGRTYRLDGPEALTGPDMARIYSRYVGRDVRYAGDDLDVWIQHVKNIMPEWLYRDMRVMYRYFQQNGMIASGADMKRAQTIVGHAPRRFDDFARELAEEWQRTLAHAA